MTSTSDSSYKFDLGTVAAGAITVFAVQALTATPIQPVMQNPDVPALKTISFPFETATTNAATVDLTASSEFLGFLENFLSSQKELDADIGALIEDNFMDLL